MHTQKIDLLPFSPLQSRMVTEGPRILRAYDRLHSRWAIAPSFILMFVWVGAILAAAASPFVIGELDWRRVALIAPGFLLVTAFFATLLARLHLAERQRRFEARHFFPPIPWIRRFLPVAEVLQGRVRVQRQVTPPDELFLDPEIRKALLEFSLGEEPGYTLPHAPTYKEIRAHVEAVYAERTIERMFGPEVMAWAASIPKADTVG